MVKKMMVNRKANKMVVRVCEVVDFLEYAVDNKALMSDEIISTFVKEYEEYVSFDEKNWRSIDLITLHKLYYNWNLAMELIDELKNNELVIY